MGYKKGSFTPKKGDSMTDKKEKPQAKNPDQKAKSPKAKKPDKKPEAQQAKKDKKPQLRWYLGDIASFLFWSEKAGKVETWDKFFAEFGKWDKAGRPEVTPDQLLKLKQRYGGDKVFGEQIQQVMDRIAIPLIIKPLFREDKEKKFWDVGGGGGPSKKEEKPSTAKAAPKEKEATEPKPSKPKAKPVVVSSGFSLDRDIKTATGKESRPPLTAEKKAELKEKWLESQRAKAMFTATSRDKCQGHF